jgi:undecaprenyl-diphosphatase
MSRIMIPQFFTRPRRALLLGAAMLAFVALLAAVIPSGPLAIDRHITGGSNAALHHLALFFDRLGGAFWRGAELIAIGICMALTRRWAALFTAAVAEAISGLAPHWLKAAVGRPRPLDPLVHTAGNSFPSGHSSYAAVTAVVLVLAFTRPGQRRLWWPLATLAIAGMCWSRVDLHVHWFSDVVAGALLGAGVAIVCFAAVSASRSTSTL